MEQQTLSMSRSAEADARREEIRQQVAEFEARGGRVQEIPSTMMARPVLSWRTAFFRPEDRR